MTISQRALSVASLLSIVSTELQLRHYNPTNSIWLYTPNEHLWFYRPENTEENHPDDAAT
jgi:hypothetical protein